MSDSPTSEIMRSRTAYHNEGLSDLKDRIDDLESQRRDIGDRISATADEIKVSKEEAIKIQNEKDNLLREIEGADPETLAKLKVLLQFHAHL